MGELGGQEDLKLISFQNSLTHHLAAFSQVMNIRMTYLYRDGGNYKYWQDTVFSNKTGKSAEALTQEIKKNLISEQYFEQSLAPIPIEIDAEYEEGLDHSWLEFHGFEEVVHEAQVAMDMEDFIQALRKSK